MRLPNGYGGVTKLSGRRRKPYMVRKTIGWHIDEKTDKKVQDYVVIGYAATKSEALQMLAEAQVDQTTIKKIVGHSGAMTMTERVYTHLDVEVIINAINKI